MGKFVGLSVVLFVLAVGFVVLAQGPEMGAMIAAFRSEPLPEKIAWAVVVLVPLCMLPFAVWLWDRLARQREETAALELRLEGLRGRVKDLSKAQIDAEADVQHLTRSDPEDAIAALQRRITEAERFAQIQQSRNESADLDSRVGAVRAQQQALKERLAPVLDSRRAIEQLFAELDSRQSDIERALAEIAGGDDGTALDLRLKNLSEFVRQSNVRCDQIEQASKTITTLNEVCADLQTRLVPFADPERGITGRLRQLGEERHRLASSIDSLERTPDGALTDRVQEIAAQNKKLDAGIAHLHAQFYQLAALGTDVAGLFAALDRALNTLAIDKSKDGATGADARVGEVLQFIERTKRQFEEIERRVTVFGELKTRLAELQSRLVPMESEETGVAKLVDDLRDMREKLIAKIRSIEGGEEGDLAERVKLFAEAKKELEDHVSSLADQFTKLSTIRKDIAGLFDKLNNAASASSH
jgi:chromosome segregation ATPase